MTTMQVQNIGMAPGPAPRAVRDSSAAQAPAHAAPVPQGDLIDKAVKALHETMQSNLGSNTRLRIEHDKTTDRYVFMSIDKISGEVMRQYPTEAMLAQIARVRQLTGLAFDLGV